MTRAKVSVAPISSLAFFGLKKGEMMGGIEGKQVVLGRSRRCAHITRDSADERFLLVVTTGGGALVSRESIRAMFYIFI